MTNQERTELIRIIIENAVKDQMFTFDHLCVQMNSNYGSADVVVTFIFNDYGNNNRSLIEDIG